VRTLLTTIFFVIAIQAHSQIVDSLPGDPCPPDTSEPKMKVYPVPSAARIRIDLGNCGEINNKLLLFAISGRLVATYTFPSSIIELNLTYLSKGIYYARIINEKRTRVCTILLQ